MAQLARVEKQGEYVEEQVTLVVGDLRLVCFAPSWPASVVVGGTYPIALTTFVIDDDELVEVDEAAVPSIDRVGDSFGHRITGRLRGGKVDAGIIFDEPEFATGYAYLDGKMVSFQVDRIHVEFFPDIAPSP